MLLSCAPAFAQKYIYEPNFVTYANYYAKEYGIAFKTPGNFTDLSQYFFVIKLRTDTAIMGGMFMGPNAKGKG
jgi:hypothetical protein